MKIAVVTRYFPSSAEPWQGRSAYQTLRLVARAAEVEVFYPNAAYPRWLRPRSRIYDGLDEGYKPQGVKASYFDYAALPLLTRPLNGWMAARALLPAVRAFAPDVVFSVFLYPDAFAGLLIARALGVPMVAMSIGSDINRIGDAISRRHTLRVLREADAVVTVSEDLRRKAVAMGAPEATSRTIVNGCDPAVFHPRSREEARVRLQDVPGFGGGASLDAGAEAVVYIGRMDVQKGLRELVGAAALLHGERPAMHVYLVGDGPDRGVVEEAIAAHGAGGYVHVMDACAPDEVAVWMAAADVVTLPSYMEGCPNVVLEALACGRPVVATRVGGIPEIMSDACGRLVAARDAAALAAGLRETLEAEWDAEAISASWGRSWDAVAAELMGVFEAVEARRAVI